MERNIGQPIWVSPAHIGPVTSPAGTRNTSLSTRAVAVATKRKAQTHPN